METTPQPLQPQQKYYLIAIPDYNDEWKFDDIQEYEHAQIFLSLTDITRIDKVFSTAEERQLFIDGYLAGRSNNSSGLYYTLDK